MVVLLNYARTGDPDGPVERAPRLCRAAERSLNNRREGGASLTSHELLQIAVMRRQDDAGAAHVAGAVVDEGQAVRLHRTIEVVEFGILAEGTGIDLRRLRVCIGADDLRLLHSLRADRSGLLLAGGLHPLER